MNSIFQKIILLSCWLFITSEAHAEVLRWPQTCLSGNLEIKNTSPYPVQAWLQKLMPTLTEETELTLAPASTRKIFLETTNLNSTFSLLHFKNSRTLKAFFRCDKKIYPATSAEGGLLTFKKSDLAKNILYLQNLFFDNNLIHIEYLNWQLQTVKNDTVLLSSFQKMNFEILESKLAWNYIRVHADNRFVAFNLNLSGASLPDKIQPQSISLPLDEEAKYFVVGDRLNSLDSFLIKLTDPLMITKAREQISNPSLEKIVFARIQKGHGQFNRNWTKLEKSFWSWSAAEVTNISDLGSTSCNGLPQAVEDRAELWINEPGRICFWSYRIKKELTASEVSTGIQLP